MSVYSPLIGDLQEPNESSIKGWMDDLYRKVQPLEQCRWNQSNIDTKFYAGNQRFVNQYFNFAAQWNYQSFYFNIVQQPVNMVTGYQRQHRKSINYLPIEGSHQEFADQLTRVEQYANTYRNRLEKYSVACEQATISGMVLMQPYLDFTDDPINGTLDLKTWSYNSVLMDPFWREPDMSDANFIWCQQYISKQVGIQYWPDRRNEILNMATKTRTGQFYFLPENYNLPKNDLLVLSYIWYRATRKKKILYDNQSGQSYEYKGQDQHIDELINSVGNFEKIEVECPTWKVAVVLNDTMMFQGYNPLQFDECPLIPVYWNYDPHLEDYNYRYRGLIRCLRDPQFLFNRRIILNHDISESSINTGYIRKINAVANEEDLKYSGQGKDIIINDGYEIADVQKIIPNSVPPSDMQLADQLMDINTTISGISKELLGMAPDSDTGIQEMLRQGAGLVGLQKYFDQWDYSLKLLGKLDKCIIQNNWSAAKIGRILGQEPHPEFFSKTYSKYDVVVAEGLNTPIQQQQEFNQIIQLNQMLGGIIPPKFILEKATIQGKNEIIEAVNQREQQAAEMAKEETMLKHTLLEAQLQNLQAKNASEIAMARERHGRAESNIGLFEERLSEITQNRSMALKNKVESLKTLVEMFTTYGESVANASAEELNDIDMLQALSEDREKDDAKLTAMSNNYIAELLQSQQNKLREVSQYTGALL